MVTGKSLYFDSIGIVAKREETEEQYHSRATQIEREYLLFEGYIRKNTDIAWSSPIELPESSIKEISESSPIEKFGFENPVMPVIYLDDSFFSKGVNGTISKIGDLYIPLIRDSLKGRSRTKRHEELHSIFYLQEDMFLIMVFFL